MLVFDKRPWPRQGHIFFFQLVFYLISLLSLSVCRINALKICFFLLNLMCTTWLCQSPSKAAAGCRAHPNVIGEHLSPGGGILSCSSGAVCFHISPLQLSIDPSMFSLNTVPSGQRRPTMSSY